METLLKEWASAMKQDNPEVLKQVHLEALFRLRTVGLYPKLFEEASHHWDHEHHVFRFGTVEICPTYEEFRACLFYHPQPVTPRPERIIRPTFQSGYSKDIQQFFGWNETEMKRHMIRDRIDVLEVAKTFRFARRDENKKQKECRGNAFLFCMIAQYLLRSSGRGGRPQIINVIKRIRNGRDIIPTVLAETMHGLDRAKHRRRCDLVDFSGSPHLLQVWLSERLKLVEPLEGPAMPIQYTIRFAVQTKHRHSDWAGILGSLEERDVRWVVDWWPIEGFVARSKNSRYVRLMGLTHTSFYVPARILRQYGLPQYNIEERPMILELPAELTEPVARIIEDAWNERVHHIYNGV